MSLASHSRSDLSRTWSGRRAIWRLARTALTARWRQLGSMLLCVAASTAFLAGALMLVAAARDSATGLSPNTATDAALQARVAETRVDSAETRLRFSGAGAPIEDSLAASARRIEGVTGVAVDLTTPVSAVTSNGTVLKGTGPSGGITQLRVWRGEAPLNRWFLTTGRQPLSGEAVIDQRLAAQGKLGLGDHLTVSGSALTRTLTVVGIAKFAATSETGTRTHGFTSDVFTDMTTAQMLTGRTGTIDRVVMSIDPARREATLRALDELAQRAHVAVEMGDDLRRNDEADAQVIVGELRELFTIFNALALFLSMFVIANAFAMLMLQRTNELALLRSLGATRSHLRRLVRIEAMCIGFAGSVLGLIGGIGIAKVLSGLLSGVGLDLDGGAVRFTPAAIVIPVAVGVGSCRVAAWRSARRSGRVAPLAARRAARIDTAGRPTITIAGTAIATLGTAAAALLATHVEDRAHALSWALAAGAAALLTFVVGGRWLTTAMFTIAAPLLDRLGPVARFARRTVARRPRRTASAASALCFGVALVSLITVFIASIEAALQTSTTAQVHADVIVRPSLNDGRTLPADTIDRVASVVGADNITGFTVSVIRPLGADTVGYAVDPKALSTMLDLGTVTGDLTSLDHGAIALSATFADNRHLHLGNNITIEHPTGTTSVRIGAIYTHEPLRATFLLGTGTYRNYVANPRTDMIFVRATNPDMTLRALVRRLGNDPTLRIDDHATFGRDYAQATGAGLLNALLGFMAVVALTGVAATLTTSVLERTPELQVMRALGMRRAQLRRLLAIEAALTGGLGSAIGITIGTATAALAVRAIRRPDVATIHIPTPRLAVILVAGIAAAVIAGLAPIRHAGQINASATR